jgi:hypothetical protein
MAGVLTTVDQLYGYISKLELRVNELEKQLKIKHKPLGNIIKNEDGSIKAFMVKVDGDSFRCECGANCFHKYEGEPHNFYCNACDMTYYGGDK